MRDHSTGRRGFEGVLMAVAATFLTVSATSVLAQSPTRSPADLAIDAAVPVPSPVDLPPPSVGDFKPETPAAKPDATAKPDIAAAPAPSEPTKDVAATPAPAAPEPSKDTAATAPAAEPKTEAPAATATAPAAVPAAPATDQATTTKPAEPQKPASTVAAADQPVADQLRDLLAKSASRYFDRKAERSAVEKFYETRDYAPVWTKAGALTAQAKGVIARLKDAAADGLDPDDYPVPSFSAATSPEALAEAELRLTESMMDYARQAQSGRMHWSQVSADIQYPEHPIDPAQVLAKVTTAADASAALDSYNPPHKLYRELKKKLAELRGEGDKPVIKIADGETLRYQPARKKRAEVKMDDPRVPQLRARLGVSENPESTTYDATVAAAVRKFQDHADLKATGVLDERTVKALNTPKRDRTIDTIIVNMERWRWLPRDLGQAHIWVNSPSYQVEVVQNGRVIHHTRAVMGRAETQTPIFSDAMSHIVFNPYWHVPHSIVRRSMLSGATRNGGYFARRGIQVVQGGRVVDASTINWASANIGRYAFRQPPGAANALGKMKFMFPNRHAIYLHDTPSRQYFGQSYRALSNGCVRVQNPEALAEVLLNLGLPGESWSSARIQGLYGPNERTVRFKQAVPIHLVYFTMTVDSTGSLVEYDDIYGHNARVRAVLTGTRG